MLVEASPDDGIWGIYLAEDGRVRWTVSIGSAETCSATH
jgi:predicted NAD-dependent protein-ADP-ribosyltransferase YbiA (DUF1768 family)